MKRHCSILFLVYSLHRSFKFFVDAVELVKVRSSRLLGEMGAHFSPCGRFLAACVTFMLPNPEGEAGMPVQAHHDLVGAATSPTRHPISAHQVMYELVTVRGQLLLVKGRSIEKEFQSSKHLFKVKVLPPKKRHFLNSRWKLKCNGDDEDEDEDQDEDEDGDNNDDQQENEDTYKNDK